MKETIARLLKKAFEGKDINWDERQILPLLEAPPSSQLGDYSFPCFMLAPLLKESPSKIALEIRNSIPHSELIDYTEANGPYVNFFLNKEKIAEQVIKEIQEKEDKFGSLTEGKGKRTMIEFSQANTHKAFHVGHVRGTSIGESLARILEFAGEKVIRANYQGDSGMHVAKWIWCYKKYHSNETPKKDESWIASIYVDAVRKLAQNEKLQLEVDEINRKLEEGRDKNLVELWQKTRKLSLDSFEAIYKQLGTRFDKYFFESQLEKRGKELAESLVKQGIAGLSEGAVIVDLSRYNLGVWVLLRSDGTVLYSAKDLALAEKKFKDFKITKSIYVVGAQQSLHLQQLFKTLELMGFKHAKSCIHIPVTEVRLPLGKMSSRTGENILYSSFMKEITDYSAGEIKKRFPKISKTELEKRSLKISIAAIKYSMLKQSLNKILVFDKQEALNFEGDTGPYILYSYARASSILKKVRKLKSSKSKKMQKTKDNKMGFEIKGKLETPEFELSKKLLQFKDAARNAYSSLNPSIIASYSYQLSQLFNEFYHSCPVIHSENEQFRLSLVNCFRQVLKNSLSLLGIETIEEM